MRGDLNGIVSRNSDTIGSHLAFVLHPIYPAWLIRRIGTKEASIIEVPHDGLRAFSRLPLRVLLQVSCPVKLHMPINSSRKLYTPSIEINMLFTPHHYLALSSVIKGCGG